MANPSVKHWQDPVNLILGLWLIASPWILEYQAETYALWSAVCLGVLIAATAVAALFRVKAWEEWANLVLGGLCGRFSVGPALQRVRCSDVELGHHRYRYRGAGIVGARYRP